MIEQSYFNENWGFILKLPKQTTLTVKYENLQEVHIKSPLLTTDLFHSFTFQPEIIELNSDQKGSWLITMAEGSNFFELDFSEFNYLLYGESTKDFRW